MDRVFKTKGVSLVEVLVSLAILSIFVLLILGISSNLLSKNTYLRDRAAAQIIKENLISVMKKDQAILFTVQDVDYNSASNFTCIVSNTDCSSLYSVDTPFALKTADNSLFMNTYNPLNASHGFNLEGKPCTTFTTLPVGSQDCPFRYTYTWTPLCEGPGLCIKPQILLKAIFYYNPGPGFTPMNTSAFSFNLYKGFSDEISVKSVCDITKGTFDSVNKTCQIPFRNFSCPGTTGLTRGVDGVPYCTAY